MMALEEQDRIRQDKPSLIIYYIESLVSRNSRFQALKKHHQRLAQTFPTVDDVEGKLSNAFRRNDQQEDENIIDLAKFWRCARFGCFWIAQIVSIFGDFLALFAVLSDVSFRLKATPAQVTLISVAFLFRSRCSARSRASS